MSAFQNRRLDIIVLVALAVVIAALYWQVIDHSFIQFDDPDYVSENFIVQKGLSWEGLLWAFTTYTLANWHPLTWLSYMLDIQMFGMKPGLLHLVNVFFHILNTCLLFWVLRQMTGALWRSAAVAALFALHPLHVESVAWVAERKDVLSTLFWLLAMGAYVRYARKPGIAGYLPVLLFFALGLMSKPMLVTLPLVLLLMDYWPLGRLDRKAEATPSPAKPPDSTGRKIRKRERQRREAPATPATSRRGAAWDRILPVLYDKMPLLMLSAASSLITLVAQQKGGAMVPLAQYTVADRISNAVVSYAAYLWKTVWPMELALFYPMEIRTVPMVAASGLFLVAVTVVVVRWARAYPYLLFGWFWYLVTMLPVIGIIKVGGAAMADRYTYVSLIGPFIALAWGAYDLSRALRIPKAALAAVSALVIGACMILSYIQIGFWKDGLTLFSRSLGVTRPNYVMLNSIGAEYIQQKKYAEALRYLHSALELFPHGHEANLNMGVALYYTGDYAGAIERCTRAVRANPDFLTAQEWLGKAYLAAGNMEGATTAFRRAIRPGRDNSPSYAGLGEALIYQNRLDEALRYTRLAIEAQPQNEKLYNNAGFILVRQGKADDAIVEFRTALKLNPDYARAHSNLGGALMQKNRIDEAVEHFETAVKLDPGNQSARENLKYAQAQKKKLGR